MMHITVEPSKPRMCHDERFLNLWIKEVHSKLDYIRDLLRYVGKFHFQTTLDNKSGYKAIEKRYHQNQRELIWLRELPLH